MIGNKIDGSPRRLYDQFGNNFTSVRCHFGISFFLKDANEPFPFGYLCPVTFDFYDKPTYDDLSREHAPQQSIGGDVVCLTSTSWNSGFGKLDNLVTQRAKALLEIKEGRYPARAFIDEGFKSRAVLVLDPTGLKISLAGGAFTLANPNFVRLIDKMKQKGSGSLKLLPLGQPTRLTRISYLKNAYLLAFATFGYHLLFCSKGIIAFYHHVRRQLRAPEEMIFDRCQFAFEIEYGVLKEGIYHVVQDQVKTIAVVFKLSEAEINLVAVVFPPLHFSLGEINNWQVTEKTMYCNKILNSGSFVPLEVILEMESVKTVTNEYPDKIE